MRCALWSKSGLCKECRAKRDQCCPEGKGRGSRRGRGGGWIAKEDQSTSDTYTKPQTD